MMDKERQYQPYLSHVLQMVDDFLKMFHDEESTVSLCVYFIASLFILLGSLC